MTAESYGGTYIPMFMVHHPLCFALSVGLACYDRQDKLFMCTCCGHDTCCELACFGGQDQIDTRGGFPNFKGAAIGDGCWGNRVGTCAFSSGKAKQIKAEFFQGHGMYDQPLYAKIKA